MLSQVAQCNIEAETTYCQSKSKGSNIKTGLMEGRIFIERVTVLPHQFSGELVRAGNSSTQTS